MDIRNWNDCIRPRGRLGFGQARSGRSWGRGRVVGTWVGVLLLRVACICPAAQPLAELRTNAATLVIDSSGGLASITLAGEQDNYLAPGQPAPLLSLRIAGELHAPENAVWDPPQKLLTLSYGSAGTAMLSVDAKQTHAVFRVVKVDSPQRVELVLWGPFRTVIGDIVGETVGVVRDSKLALGIQALNPKTLGGYPEHESDTEKGYSRDDSGSYPDLPAELKQGQAFRGDTARHTEEGSSLQAYCRNRDQDRTIPNWGFEAYFAPGFQDGGVVGSAIALFACPAPQALETIGAIELAEGLPHPMLDGTWGKISPRANCSYLIIDFSESNIEQAVEMTRRAGLDHVYHSSPFETWGHFQLKASLFPHGWQGFQACVDQAARSGVKVGFHTLSNFITPNDPYVTPTPDPRLARIGVSALTADLDVAAVDIVVAAPECFRKTTPMNTVAIGNELIRYESVSEESPWRLLKCQRGAWGTTAAAHSSGSAVGKLMDHSYGVFLTDADLSQEVARNVARFCNDTGARQISLDGLEGNWSTGMGQYGSTLFTKAWYDTLSSSFQGGVINDASNPGHFSWHIYTRMNWGEPWYAGFRESQTLYRFKNQLYFEAT